MHLCSLMSGSPNNIQLKKNQKGELGVYETNHGCDLFCRMQNDLEWYLVDPLSLTKML